MNASSSQRIAPPVYSYKAPDNQARTEIQETHATNIVSHLWPKNDESENGIRSAFFIAPTGFGKTHTSMTVHNLGESLNHNGNAQSDQGSTFFVVDSLHIAEQTAKAAKSYGLSNVHNWTDGKFDEKNRGFIVATTDTLKLALDSIQPDKFPKARLLILDEAHHAVDPNAAHKISEKRNGETQEHDGSRESSAGTEHAIILSELGKRNPRLAVLAMTATDRRGDDLPLHPTISSAPRFEVSRHTSLSVGATVPPHTIVPEILGKDDVPISMHLATEAVRQTTNRKHIPDAFSAIVRDKKPENFHQQVVGAWEKHTPGEPSFAFSETIKEASDLAESFRSAGHSARVVHSKMSKKDIDEAMEAYKKGEVTILSTARMLGTGVDIPKTSTILNLHTRTNSSELIQWAGRASRAYENPETGVGKTHANILEFGATPYITGTVESLHAVQTASQHSVKASGLRPLNKQTTPQEQIGLNGQRETGHAHVITTPDEAYFAFPTKTVAEGTGQSKYRLIRISQKKPPSREGAVANQISSDNTAQDIRAFARTTIKRHEDFYTRNSAIDPSGHVISGLLSLREGKDIPPTMNMIASRQVNQNYGNMAAHMNNAINTMETSMSMQHHIDKTPSMPLATRSPKTKKRGMEM